MRPGLVEILESCYSVDGDIDSWMRGVGQAIDAHLGYGLGAIAIRYRLGDDSSFQPMTMLPVNMSDAGVAVVQGATANLPASYVRATFASLPADIASNTGPDEVRALTSRIYREHFEPQGWHDTLCINALDPTRHGLYLGAWMPKRQKLTSNMRARWSRVAAHMAAAHRLRNRLGDDELRSADTADAILTPDGRVEHATGEAKDSGSRAALTDGARTVDRARGKLRRTDPDLALAEWRALLAARWTLVDHFESDGKRYVLARRNAAVPRGLDVLTPRERQALGFAQLGHSNKLIAYEMGVAASTVAVLLYRAAKKLGCKREALIETYARMLGLRE